MTEFCNSWYFLELYIPTIKPFNLHYSRFNDFNEIKTHNTSEIDLTDSG